MQKDVSAYQRKCHRLNFQFGKQRRILKKAEFNDVFQQGKRYSTPDFVILYRRNSFDLARLGFVISKKNVAKAHDRNKIKRTVREAFRTRPELPNLDVVFLAKHKVHLMDRSLFKEKIEEIWCKLINLSAKQSAYPSTDISG